MLLQKMYTNQSNKLSYRDRLGIIKQYSRRRKKAQIAKYYNISRQSVYDIIIKFEKYGVFGLEDQKPGRLKEPVSPNFYANVVRERKLTSWGACRLEKYFNKKGFSVSHNKINEIIEFENLKRPKMGKREKPKYISYEADECNDQWHIDWSNDPISKLQLLAIIDDKSRFIVYAGLFHNATGENSAIGLQKAIDKFGAPKELVSDNGSHFKSVHTKKTPCKPMRLVEEKYKIKHIFIRAYYPQSNGKIERWFGSYKGEFPLMEHPDVYDCLSYVEFYNKKRIHQSLGYETPAHIYLSVK